jgi:tRNA-dihydrouridine synthase A
MTEYQSDRFAIAPMMDWTDRHCRFFHRLMTKHALLYTEMVVADAILHGDPVQLLGFDPAEHPVALQLGGSDPEKLARAARTGEVFGYDEINLNVGCPSDRVQSGTFGACLMQEPELVARCVGAMKAEVSIPVTVKCRIGVDDQIPEIALLALAKAVWEAGCDRLWVHARKAWLQGLSPKENRDIPPLDYDLVYRLKQENPDQFVGINGGIETISDAVEHLQHVDGTMLGRAPYRRPDMLRSVDSRIFDDHRSPISLDMLCDAMCDYAEMHLSRGGRLNHITRHMIGLFQSVSGARRYRQILSVESTKEKTSPEIIRLAFSAVDYHQLDAA